MEIKTDSNDGTLILVKQGAEAVSYNLLLFFGLGCFLELGWLWIMEYFALMFNEYEMIFKRD